MDKLAPKKLLYLVWQPDSKRKAEKHACFIVSTT